MQLPPNAPVLFVRFSSIGDIILTTPLIRSLKKARPDVEIHYATKAAYHPLLQHNPYIHQIHLLHNNFPEFLSSLKTQNFYFLFDLHKNLRTVRLKFQLGCPSAAFPKANWQKYQMVRFKSRLVLPHIVNRYAKVLEDVELSLDDGGLELFLPNELEAKGKQLIAHLKGEKIAVVLGAKHATKKWLSTSIRSFCNQYGKAVVLIGGKDDVEAAKKIKEGLKVDFVDAVGKYGLLKSAALLKACDKVLAHDTGFMHIAAAFHKPIVSIWGNTVPEFGMTPYRTNFMTIEKQLACRPCSKIGYDRCPKKHFQCMKEIAIEEVVQAMRDV